MSSNVADSCLRRGQLVPRVQCIGDLMAHSDKKQTDFNQQPNTGDRERAISLSRDVRDVNSGLRIDFDQKLAELTELLARFKALVAVTPSQDAMDDSNAIATPSTLKPVNVAPIASAAPSSDSKTGKPEAVNVESSDSSHTVVPPDTAPQISTTSTSTPSRYAPEPARFETALYKLNCQLYRFRLELDQEMEFREEPLHEHFRQESELSVVLQKLNDKSSEINPDS